jgi:hypothetical protein
LVLDPSGGGTFNIKKSFRFHNALTILNKKKQKKRLNILVILIEVLRQTLPPMQDIIYPCKTSWAKHHQLKIRRVVRTEFPKIHGQQSTFNQPKQNITPHARHYLPMQNIIN